MVGGERGADRGGGGVGGEGASAGAGEGEAPGHHCGEDGVQRAAVEVQRHQQLRQPLPARRLHLRRRGAGEGSHPIVGGGGRTAVAWGQAYAFE